MSAAGRLYMHATRLHPGVAGEAHGGAAELGTRTRQCWLHRTCVTEILIGNHYKLLSYPETLSRKVPQLLGLMFTGATEAEHNKQAPHFQAVRDGLAAVRMVRAASKTARRTDRCMAAEGAAHLAKDAVHAQPGPSG